MSILNFARSIKFGDLRDRENRLRTYAFIGNCVLLPPIGTVVVYQYFQGFNIVLGLTFLLFVVVCANLYVLSRRYSRWLSRLAALVCVVTVIISLFVYDSRVTLIWSMVIPPLLVFTFGPREGLLWAFGLFLPAVIYAATSATELVFHSAEIVVALVLVSCLTVLFTWVFKTIFKQSYSQLAQGGANLTHQERRFNEFSELASEWFFEIDANYKFVYTSENFITLMPRQSPSLSGDIAELGLSEVMANACVEGAEDFIETSMQHKEVANHRLVFEFFNTRYVVNLNAHPIYEDGKFAGYRGVATNLTDIEAVNEQFWQQERVLYHAQKMEAVGQLSSGIAHDFNNLLTVIRGNLELLEFDLPHLKSNPQLEEAKRASESASQLTSNMLAFARRQPLRSRPMDVCVLLENMQPILRQSLSEAVSVEIVSAPALWLCMVDPVQLESALLNLAINARDAMPDGGSVRIELENEHVSEHDELQAGDYVKISMTDSGTGIDESIQDLVFDPFFSTKPQGVGSGLGLSMVYGFIRQSNGAIRISSEVNVGTTLTFWLPRGVEELSGDMPRKSDTAIPEKLSIMVVEDDEGVRALISAMLNIMGHEGAVFASSQLALTYVLENDIDMLITDIVLANGESGLDLAKSLRCESLTMPILFISGYAQPLSNSDFRLDEHMALLNKPFGVGGLADAINSLVSS